MHTSIGLGGEPRDDRGLPALAPPAQRWACCWQMYAVRHGQRERAGARGAGHETQDQRRPDVAPSGGTHDAPPDGISPISSHGQSASHVPYPELSEHGTGIPRAPWSSRFMPKSSRRRGQRPQQRAHALERGAQLGRRQPVAEAHVRLHAEVCTGHDQHVLLDA